MHFDWLPPLPATQRARELYTARVLSRAKPRYNRDRIRLERIRNIHPLLRSSLEGELRAALPHVDDWKEGPRFDELLHLLPSMDDTYFAFDAWVLRSLLETFNGQAVGLSGAIIPSYWNEWQWARTNLPRFQHGQPQGGRSLEFIRIRRSGQAQPVLDDLVWMVHEVGHHLFSVYHDALPTRFLPALEAVLLDLNVGMLNDKGHARELAERHLDQLRAVWTPTGKQQDWTHELAIDALSLWVAGPAYALAFMDEYREAPDRHNPHQLDQHPPIRMRAEALRNAATTLGWTEAADGLRRLMAAWSARPHDASDSNVYASLILPELVGAAQQAAWQVARDLCIQPFTPEDLRRVEQALDAPDELESRDLMVAAWRQRERLPSLSALEAWEGAVVDQTLAVIS